MNEQHTYNPVAVVNEADEVIGAMSVPEAIQQGLIRRSARVLIYDECGRLLLQKRSQRVNKPGLLDHSASGHVDAGEAYNDAALRELYEETGISRKNLTNLLPAYRCYELGTADFFATLYKITIQSDFPIVYSPDEIAAVYWYTESELTIQIRNYPELFTPAFREDWEVRRSYFFTTT